MASAVSESLPGARSPSFLKCMANDARLADGRRVRLPVLIRASIFPGLLGHACVCPGQVFEAAHPVRLKALDHFHSQVCHVAVGRIPPVPAHAYVAQGGAYLSRGCAHWRFSHSIYVCRVQLRLPIWAAFGSPARLQSSHSDTPSGVRRTRAALRPDIQTGTMSHRQTRCPTETGR